MRATLLLAIGSTHAGRTWFVAFLAYIGLLTSTLGVIGSHVAEIAADRYCHFAGLLVCLLMWPPRLQGGTEPVLHSWPKTRGRLISSSPCTQVELSEALKRTSKGSLLRTMSLRKENCSKACDCLKCVTGHFQILGHLSPQATKSEEITSTVIPSSSRWAVIWRHMNRTWVCECSG